MIKKPNDRQNESQSGSISGSAGGPAAQKGQGWQQRPDQQGQGWQQKPDQQNRSRPFHQNYGRAQKVQGQVHQQNSDRGEAQGSTGNDAAAQGQAVPQNMPGNVESAGHVLKQNSRSSRAYDPHSRDASQQKGYGRDRGRENELQQQRHPGAISGRHGNFRNRAEETIEDIKHDITRLEKEIELEIKEIRSLKL